MIKEERILIQRLQSLKNKVKDNLKSKGIVVPVKTSRGLKLDDYEIVLEKTGYVVYNKYNEKAYYNLYYLQTAVLIANALASGRTVRNEWVVNDRAAGVSDFDKDLFEHRLNVSLKRKDLFGIQHYHTRLTESKLKHKNYMNSLNNSYMMLLNSLKSIEKYNKYS
jgi:hypothetical protein